MKENTDDEILLDDKISTNRNTPETSINSVSPKTSENPNELALKRKPGKEILEDINLIIVNGHLSTTNEILEKETEKNEDMFIFDITGKTSTFTISWKIYRNAKQIREIFSNLKKNLLKNNIFSKEDPIIEKCQKVKDFTSGELYKNINKISDDILEFYNNPKIKNIQCFKEFLRISATSFISDNFGKKPLEGYAYKKAEPRGFRFLLRYSFFCLEYCFFKGWNKRWVVLKDDMICYLNSPTTSVGKNVYWFDDQIEIIPKKDTILEIKNNSRSLELKFESNFERDVWEKEINERIEKRTSEITNNEYQSFTCQKQNCGAKWFVDAKNYFEYLLQQLLKANESVYITDWFLSPELALRRPISYDEYKGELGDSKKHQDLDKISRLMDVLYYLAKKGIKVNVLIYKEFEIALAINSTHAKNTLQNLHENIKVTRHPKKSLDILWSHHEKLVIIDQRIAFVGGLDLCWGRYDSNLHPVTEEDNKEHLYYYPGSDYVNERDTDMHNVENFYMEQVSRNKKPRMPWHDVHTMVEGPIVSDIVRHFVERWNHARFQNRDHGLVNTTSGSIDYSNQNYQFEKKEKNWKKFLHFGKKKSDVLEQNIEMSDVKNNGHKKKFSFSMPPGVSSSIIDDNNINSINNDNNDNNKENIEDEESFLEDRDIIKEFKKKEYDNANNNIITDDDIEKKYESDGDSDDEKPNKNNVHLKRRFTIFTNMKNKMKTTLNSYKRKHGKHNKNQKLKQNTFLYDDQEEKDTNIEMNCKIQALRSVCSWSIGKNNNATERSILQGYYKLIDNSKHYIYIENQFFVTKPFSEDERIKSGINLDKIVQNEIGLHIRNRIEKAYENKENFKVFICIPLLPGFSGVPGKSPTMNAVLKHTYQSICNNKGFSLIELLKKKMGDDVLKYIYFFSLRNHGVIKGNPVTEQIYIHSKLLIIDDEKVLIGSANINDRSMKGSRDSEFAVIIESEKNFESVMDGRNFLAAEYAISLRKHLMGEHFGINVNDEILDDPLSEKLWSLMKNKAHMNSILYRDIFDCYPDNKFSSYDELEKRKMFTTKEEIEEQKKIYENTKDKIDGQIVEYPLEFLKNEQLSIAVFSKENMLPEKNFT